MTIPSVILLEALNEKFPFMVNHYLFRMDPYLGHCENPAEAGDEAIPQLDLEFSKLHRWGVKNRD